MEGRILQQAMHYAVQEGVKTLGDGIATPLLAFGKRVRDALASVPISVRIARVRHLSIGRRVIQKGFAGAVDLVFVGADEL